MRLVSVDCGVRGCGVAVFDNGRLTRATYVKNPQTRGRGAESVQALSQAVLAWAGMPDRLAIETMQIYEADQHKGDQNDLLAVQLVAGALIGRLNAMQSVSYVPREWKGTIDGDVCTERILERLTSFEVSQIVRVSETVDHNTIDGIGIGLKYLGRFEPRRVFARD